MTRLERLRARLVRARKAGRVYVTDPVRIDDVDALLAVVDAVRARRRLAHGRDPQAYLAALAASPLRWPPSTARPRRWMMAR